MDISLNVTERVAGDRWIVLVLVISVPGVAEAAAQHRPGRHGWHAGLSAAAQARRAHTQALSTTEAMHGLRGKRSPDIRLVLGLRAGRLQDTMSPAGGAMDRE